MKVFPAVLLASLLIPSLCAGEAPPDWHHMQKNYHKTQAIKLDLPPFPIVDWSKMGYPITEGANDPALLSMHYREAVDDWEKDPGVGVPGLEVARANIETVARLSIYQFKSSASDSGLSSIAKKLDTLELVSIDEQSLAATSKRAGIFTGKAVFFDKSIGKNVDAEITGDFSDPHWHLSQIKLLYPAPPRPKAKRVAKAPPPPPMTPEQSFAEAVRSYVKLNRKPGRGLLIKDAAREVPWEGVLVTIHTEAMKDLGNGLYSAPVDFVDRTQDRTLTLEFPVRRKDGIWSVEDGAPPVQSADGTLRPLTEDAHLETRSDVRLTPNSAR